jgi:chromate transporter
MKVLLLFLTFLKIGFIGFGGGYGMLPLIESEIVGKNWLSKKEFWDLVAIAGSTPGSIAVNVATFVGYRIAGVIGAALSTIGVVLPAFLVILLVIMGLGNLLKTEQARWIQNGMKSAIIGFLLMAAYSLYSVIDSPKKVVVSLAAASFVLVFLGINPFLLIVLFAVLGFFLGRFGIM